MELYDFSNISSNGGLGEDMLIDDGITATIGIITNFSKMNEIHIEMRQYIDERKNEFDAKWGIRYIMPNYFAIQFCLLFDNISQFKSFETIPVREIIKNNAVLDAVVQIKEQSRGQCICGHSYCFKFATQVFHNGMRLQIAQDCIQKTRILTDEEWVALKKKNLARASKAKREVEKEEIRLKEEEAKKEEWLIRQKKEKEELNLKCKNALMSLVQMPNCKKIFGQDLIQMKVDYNVKDKMKEVLGRGNYFFDVEAKQWYVNETLYNQFVEQYLTKEYYEYKNKDEYDLCKLDKTLHREKGVDGKWQFYNFKFEVDELERIADLPNEV